MKLQKVKNSYHVYIPRNLVEDVLMWEKGDEIECAVIYEKGIPVLKLQKSILSERQPT